MNSPEEEPASNQDTNDTNDDFKEIFNVLDELENQNNFESEKAAVVEKSDSSS